jgi:hypothetical protein
LEFSRRLRSTHDDPADGAQQYDAIWRGSAHRNVCVPIRNSRTTVKVDGMPEYQLYFVRSESRLSTSAEIFAEGLETPGKVDVDTPDEPHTNGDVCLGIAN